MGFAKKYVDIEKIEKYIRGLIKKDFLFTNSEKFSAGSSASKCTFCTCSSHFTVSLFSLFSFQCRNRLLLRDTFVYGISSGAFFQISLFVFRVSFPRGKLSSFLIEVSMPKRKVQYRSWSLWCSRTTGFFVDRLFRFRCSISHR